MRLFKTVVVLNLLAPLWGQDIEWQILKEVRLRSHIRAPGKIVPRDGALSVESARVQGRVTTILKREGEHVFVGTPLFGINSAECLSLLQEERVATERDLPDMLQASQRRREQLSLYVSPTDCKILATHTGTISKRQVELGSAFNVGDALATIIDSHNLGIDLDVPERDLSVIHEGQRVQVEMASNPGHIISTTVESILPTIDPVTRTSKARLSVHTLPEGARVDALVFAQIDVPHSQSVFNIPTTALIFSHNQQYVIKQRDKPVAVAVDVLDETSDSSSVLPHRAEDLQPGDRIAVKGALFLFNDARAVE